MSEENTLRGILTNDGSPAGDEIDPVIAMIAEENRLCCRADELSDAADELLFALPEAKRREVEKMDRRDRPGQIGELYRQAAPLYEEGNKLFQRIKETKPVTLAGAIAMLEEDEREESSGEFAPAVLGWLRDIARQGRRP